jgi:hypothetical protein
MTSHPAQTTGDEVLALRLELVLDPQAKVGIRGENGARKVRSMVAMIIVCSFRLEVVAQSFTDTVFLSVRNWLSHSSVDVEHGSMQG